MKQQPNGNPAPAEGSQRKVADIRSVAEKAGVSISTVSRFLNHKVVSPQAEERIREAVKELAYIPNRIARSLKLRRTNTLGLAIPDITNTFFPEIVKGVEDAARTAGFAVVLTNTGEDQASEWECLNTLETLRCDGCLLILAPDDQTDARKQRLAEYRLPVVYVDRSPSFESDQVVSDNVLGAEEAVRHLIGLGHKNIALLGTTLEVSTHRDRVQGYRKALKAAGLEPPAGYEIRVAPTLAEGHTGTLKLLDLQPRPSAIFVTSNKLTIAAMAAIHDRGLRCPADISVIGYDNYEWEESFRPRLTTVAQPSYLIGQRAAELLIARILGQKSGPPEQVVVPSNLVVRESCAPLVQ
jgi:DNA-binding LacI/PurR family transcriptional regulator